MAAAAGGAIRSSNLARARTSERIVSGLRCMRPKGRSVDPKRRIFRATKKKADALVDLAISNFIEMRDKTASKAFRAKKKLDHLLEALLPGIYLPLYTMVTFTRIPYAEAARRAQLQDRIVYGTLIAAVILIVSLLVHFATKRG